MLRFWTTDVRQRAFLRRWLRMIVFDGDLRPGRSFQPQIELFGLNEETLNSFLKLVVPLARSNEGVTVRV